jgi:putative ATP-binding cassette transporter
LNGYAVTPANYPYYRNQLSCIFTDNYLFSDNYDGFDLKPSNERLQFLINKMGLSEIIQLDDSKNKLKTTLSKGQQKRLALILSLLENKDILVLDEWAAEQDPLFREYFYQQIIPELKDMGKTVIAVTHDDAYFDCAERIVKFDFGRIASDTKLLKREAAVVD